MDTQFARLLLSLNIFLTSRFDKHQHGNSNMDFGKALSCKQDDIIQDWIAQVRGDSNITSTRNLTSQAILNSLPRLIEAIAQLLSQPLSSETDRLLSHGMEHGMIRAKQGYDAEEIAWEYSTLRDVIFAALENDLLQSQPSPMLRAIRLIDGAIDQAVAFCMKRYTDERLKEVNLLYDELLVSNRELDWLVRAEKANRAHLTHEIKSPLTSIIGYSELFLRQQKMSEVHPEYIERVLTGGRQLLALVNETLAASSYDAKQAAVDAQPVEVCRVVTEVVTALDILAQQKDLQISVDCKPIGEPVLTDGGRLRQIVTNLVSNAIRYTESGQIKISVRLLEAGDPLTTDCLLPVLSSKGCPDEAEDSPLVSQQAADLTCAETDEVTGDRVEIQVTDTGLGIDVDEQSRIFEPYYQGRAGRCSADSTGLGLAITYQMVRLLQGNIYLKSAPEVGSTFTIILPLRYRAIPVKVPVEDKQPSLQQ